LAHWQLLLQARTRKLPHCVLRALSSPALSVDGLNSVLPKAGEVFAEDVCNHASIPVASTLAPVPTVEALQLPAVPVLAMSFTTAVCGFD
jgi:hypothetical protein